MVAELVDALASGVSAFGCEGSSPSYRTTTFDKVFVHAVGRMLIQPTTIRAMVAELVDALASGVSAFGCEGSSPSYRTT
jgi:ABC-type taurine transport system substrate-binding protein